MLNPVLIISDGTTRVNLLDLRGWTLNDWRPAVPEPKGGGVFRNSPLTDGRKLAFRKMDNITDTFNLVGSSESQDIMIASIQNLERLLEKATEYWTSDWQNEPVWIEARAAKESSSRYATIVDYRFTGFGGPYRQPFFSSDCSSATEAILIIEHRYWQETIPGKIGECVELHNETEYPVVIDIDSDTFAPNASASDATYSPELGTVDLTSNNLDIGYVGITAGNKQSGIIFDNIAIPTTAMIINAVLNVTSASMVYVGTADIVIRGQSQRGGVIDSVTLTNGGKNYVNPYVVITDSGLGAFTGTAANIALKTVNGVITEIYIIDGGKDYVTPKLTIYDYAGQGTGATATCTATAKGVDATIFDGTIPDFVGRSKTEKGILVHLEDGVHFTGNYNVTDIIKEIINSSYWSSGDDLGIFIGIAYGVGGRDIHSFDNGSDYATLYIEWSTSTTPLGRDTTCAQEVFVANKYTRANITHAYYKDDDAGWSDNFIGESMPFQMLPAVPAIGDRIYFGCDTSLENSGPFNNLVFDLYSVAVGVTGVWKYYNGAWVVFDVSGGINNQLCGDQINFTRLGVSSVVWEQQADWTPVAVNGVTGFWVCFEVTDGGTAPPYQWHRDIYTAILPYIDISAEEVPGDIPALARLLYDTAGCYERGPNMLILGLRSLSRGGDFMAYLNASDAQCVPGMTFEVTAPPALITSPHVPTGKFVLTTGFVQTTMSEICKWTMTGSLAKQYVGTYHAYMRCYFYSAADSVVKLQLRGVFGEGFNVSYSEITSVATSLYFEQCVDLGQFIIPPIYTMHKDDLISSVSIHLDAYSETAGVGFGAGEIYDLILIPADEWAGNFSAQVGGTGAGTSRLEYGKGLDIDAITNPRQYRSPMLTKTYSPNNDIVQNTYYSGDYMRVASGEPIFNSNVDQRLWFLQARIAHLTFRDGLVSFFENCGVVRAERSARYILMRGSR